MCLGGNGRVPELRESPRCPGGVAEVLDEGADLQRGTEGTTTTGPQATHADSQEISSTQEVRVGCMDLISPTSSLAFCLVMMAYHLL